LALRAVGVQAGDEVVLAAYDFPGNFRAIEAIGAVPVLVDIELDTCGLDVQQFCSACTSGRVRAVVVSHLHGGLADMATICEHAQRFDVRVVEDACQAPGAVVQGRRAGTWGDVGVLSFGGSKLLTAGRGGALLTRHADVLQRATIFCERGNHAFPLSEIQAALLIPQLKRLEERNRRRQAMAAEIFQRFKGMPHLAPVVSRDRGQASYYKVAWRVTEATGRDTVLAAGHRIGADLGAGFRGFFRRSVRRCRHIGQLPHSRSAAEQLVLLHHPLLLEATATDIDLLAMALGELPEEHNAREDQ
jgi:dTDP-4-amino-4,6-dideoxygalactose transaminase